MLTMGQKKAITRELRDKYQEARKKKKQSFWMNLPDSPVTIVVMPVKYSIKPKYWVIPT